MSAPFFDRFGVNYAERLSEGRSIGSGPGGSGNDMIIAGAGHDYLNGGSGDDLLIAGTGADVLKGRSGNDLLIAGSTVYDDSQVDLDAIFAEWTSNNSYADRVANLRASTGDHLDGINLTTNLTVLDDDDKETLFGGSGRDYFFASAHDRVRDKRWYEFLDELSGS